MLFCQVKCKKICGCVQVSDEVHLKLREFGLEMAITLIAEGQ